MKLQPLLITLALLVSTISTAESNQSRLIIQSTTSPENAGLYAYLLPIIARETGISAHVVAVGTGQALRNAENCDGDLLIIHDTLGEEAFVDAGFGVRRDDLMYNDFVLVGNANDPAGLREKKMSIYDALRAIADTQSRFVSRGDDSGTHRREQLLWVNIDMLPELEKPRWYRSVGRGMGATLNTAVEMDAYTLTDRASWLAFGNQQNHTILHEGDPILFNQYGIIPISPSHCPDANIIAANTVRDFLLSPMGQQAIANFTLEGNDEPLFYPNPR